MKIWYNVRDGGDGSAYPKFFTSEALAELDDEFMVEFYDGGWGEMCVGYIEVTTPGDYIVCDEATTPEEYVKEVIEFLGCDQDDLVRIFIKKAEALL